MKAMLKGGTTIIIDRYAFSGVAYTAAKQVYQVMAVNPTETVDHTLHNSYINFLGYTIGKSLVAPL